MQQLEIDINNSISKITSGGPKGYRCHEIARLLQRDLSSRGYDCTVKDGVAYYKTAFLDDLFSIGLDQFLDFASIIMDEEEKKMIELEKEAMKLEMKLRYEKNPLTKSYYHSWVEIGNFIADYQNAIEAEKQSWTGIFIFRNKEELKDNAFYTPCGKEFKMLGQTLLYLPPMHVIKLRV